MQMFLLLSIHKVELPNQVQYYRVFISELRERRYCTNYSEPFFAQQNHVSETSFRLLPIAYRKYAFHKFEFLARSF